MRAHRFLCSIACTIKLASYDIPLIIQWAENRIGWLNAETAAEFLCCHACDMITISSTAWSPNLLGNWDTLLKRRDGLLIISYVLFTFGASQKPAFQVRLVRNKKLRCDDWVVFNFKDILAVIGKTWLPCDDGVTTSLGCLSISLSIQRLKSYHQPWC